MSAPGDDPLHPRHSPDLIGHDAAQAALLAAMASKRIHHAWLITGPKGVGKASLAYRAARHLLAQPADEGASLFDGVSPPVETLDLPEAHAVFQRVASGGHANLMVLERGWDEKRKMVRGEILVDDVRRLHRFFTQTAAEGGWRICIVDSADEMNRNAANALLKILEEPPVRSLLLLVSHAPGRLLPTIRSRCRTLKLSPLTRDEVIDVLARRRPDLAERDAAGLAALAEGAPGRALALAEQDGLKTYREMIKTLSQMPGLDLPAAHSLAGRLAGKAAEPQYRAFTELYTGWVAKMVRGHAAGAPAQAVVEGEAAAQARFATALSLDRWVEVWETMTDLIARADAVHLDRKQVVLSLLTMMDQAARGRSPA